MNRIDGFKGARGSSLVLVLIVLTAFSIIAIHQAHLRNLKSDENAFYFTVAQVQYALNLANAYRLENGGWPHGNSGGCRAPHSLISQQTPFVNGWGQDLGATGNCNGNNDSYRLTQFVPSKYENQLSATFTESVSFSNNANAPAGYRQMQISMNVASVVNKYINVGELTDDRTINSFFENELVFVKVTCSKGEVLVAGMDGICVRGEEKAGAFPWVHSSPADLPIAEGFSVTLDSNGIFGKWRVGYDMWIRNAVDYSEYGEWDTKSLGHALYDSDGYKYADEDCQFKENSNKQHRIKAVLLSWCEEK